MTLDAHATPPPPSLLFHDRLDYYKSHQEAHRCAIATAFVLVGYARNLCLWVLMCLSAALQESNTNNRETDDPHGVVPLRTTPASTLEVLEGLDEYDWGFKLVTPGRTFLVKVESEEVQVQWMAAINAVIQGERSSMSRSFSRDSTSHSVSMVATPRSERESLSLLDFVREGEREGEEECKDEDPPPAFAIEVTPVAASRRVADNQGREERKEEEGEDDANNAKRTPVEDRAAPSSGPPSGDTGSTKMLEDSLANFAIELSAKEQQLSTTAKENSMLAKSLREAVQRTKVAEAAARQAQDAASEMGKLAQQVPCTVPFFCYALIPALLCVFTSLSPTTAGLGRRSGAAGAN